MASGDLKRLMIPFKGIEQRAKYEDGAMRDLMNLRVRDGVLRVCPNPQVVGSFGDRKVEFMHFHKGWLLYVSGGSLYAVKCGEDYALPEDIVGSSVLVGSVTEGAKVTGLEVLGNLVCVVCDEGVEYALWKDGEYKWLGRFPELVEIQFGARKGTVFTLQNKADLEGIPRENGWFNFFRERYMNAYNKEISSIEQKSGKMWFTGPVLVRYAYRLFDGSYVSHSCPVLLMPMERSELCSHPQRIERLKLWFDQNYLIINGGLVEGFDFNGTEADQYLYFDSDLCAFIDRDFSDRLDRWSDIISGVSIFVSEPLFSGDNVLPIIFEGKLYIQAMVDAIPIIKGYKVDNVGELEKCSVFYKLLDIKLSDLLEHAGKRTILPNKECTVKSSRELKHQEVMSNVSYSHHRVGANRSYVFNNRLRLGDVLEHLYEGHRRELGFLPADGASPIMYNGIESHLGSNVGEWSYCVVDVYLKVDGVEYKVSRRVGCTHFGSYLSYPDPRASRMVFHLYTDEDVSIADFTFDLKPHATLDIAYFIGSYDGILGLPVEGHYRDANGGFVNVGSSLRSVWQGEQ